MTKYMAPCPFCAVELYPCEYNGGQIRYAHEVNGCILSRKFVRGEDEETLWNRRASPPSPNAAIFEALAREIEKAEQEVTGGPWRDGWEPADNREFFAAFVRAFAKSGNLSSPPSPHSSKPLWQQDVENAEAGAKAVAALLDNPPESISTGVTDEFIRRVAIHLHTRDADDHTVKWAKQPGKYRASLLRDARDVIASIHELGFSIVKTALAAQASEGGRDA